VPQGEESEDDAAKIAAIMSKGKGGKGGKGGGGKVRPLPSCLLLGIGHRSVEDA
jgi:hypothetical protein